jgi:hypothetical protein
MVGFVNERAPIVNAEFASHGDTCRARVAALDSRACTRPRTLPNPPRRAHRAESLPRDSRRGAAALRAPCTALNPCVERPVAHGGRCRSARLARAQRDGGLGPSISCPERSGSGCASCASNAAGASAPRPSTSESGPRWCDGSRPGRRTPRSPSSSASRELLAYLSSDCSDRSAAKSQCARLCFSRFAMRAAPSRTTRHVDPRNPRSPSGDFNAGSPEAAAGSESNPMPGCGCAPSPVDSRSRGRQIAANCRPRR